MIEISLTLSHVEPDRVAGGVGRGARVVARVSLTCLVDDQGGEGGVGGGQPQLVLPLLQAAHLARGHRDPSQEVDHRVVVIPANNISIETLNQITKLCIRVNKLASPDKI